MRVTIALATYAFTLNTINIIINIIILIIILVDAEAISLGQWFLPQPGSQPQKSCCH